MLLTLIVDSIFMVVGAFFMAAWYERKIRLIRRENLNKNIKRWKAGYDAGARHGRQVGFFRPVRDFQLPDKPGIESTVNPRSVIKMPSDRLRKDKRN